MILESAVPSKASLAFATGVLFAGPGATADAGRDVTGPVGRTFRNRGGIFLVPVMIVAVCAFVDIVAAVFFGNIGISVDAVVNVLTIDGCGFVKPS